MAFRPLRQELAPHPSAGLTPAGLAALLAGAETGDLTAQAALAEDMEEFQSAPANYGGRIYPGRCD